MSVERLEARIDRLADRVAELAGRVARIEGRLDERARLDAKRRDERERT